MMSEAKDILIDKIISMKPSNMTSIKLLSSLLSSLSNNENQLSSASAVLLSNQTQNILNNQNFVFIIYIFQQAVVNKSIEIVKLVKYYAGRAALADFVLGVQGVLEAGSNSIQVRRMKRFQGKSSKK